MCAHNINLLYLIKIKTLICYVIFSVDMQSQYNCLQELTEIKTSSSESSTLMSSLCDIMQSVSGCLATSNISSAPNYNMYLRNVKDKVDHTKTFACNYGKVFFSIFYSYLYMYNICFQKLMAD
jgi:hypothetical protein